MFTLPTRDRKRHRILYRFCGRFWRPSWDPNRTVTVPKIIKTQYGKKQAETELFQAFLEPRGELKRGEKEAEAEDLTRPGP